MAIHVRPRRSQIATINRRNRQRSIIAICVTTTLLLLLGFTLYFVRILILQDTPPSFLAYVPNEDNLPIDSKAPTIKELTPSGASPSSSVMPSIIVSTGASAVAMEPMDFSMDAMGLGSADLGGLGMGFGSLGNGLGKGMGDGIGDGNGKGSSGGGKKGLNDDIQVVLVLDASGSMDQLFTIVSDALHEFLVTLNHCTLNEKQAKVNVGIVSYGQAKDNGAPQIISPFSKDVATMRSKLGEVSCDGAFENCGEAIAFAVEKFPWNLRDRDDMLKIIFIAGNEEFTQGEVDYHTAMRKARQHNIIVNTICCGYEDPVWKEAAREGRGEGFSIAMQAAMSAEAQPRASEEQQLAMAQDLCAIPIIPCGSPQERARHDAELSRLAHKPNKKDFPKWVQNEGRELVQGFAWDAVEICRREGKGFTLAMVGGLPNLPPQLRALGEGGALDHLLRAAEARQYALDNYNQALFGNNEFCAKALDVIRRQAADKGIDMKI